MSPTAKPKTTKAAANRSVGQILKQRRQDKGFTLKQVEVATRIRGKYLLAIEADDYTALPPDAYARGFIHSYAEYMGMDGDKVAARYQKEAGETTPQIARAGRPVTARVWSPRMLTAATALITLVTVAGYLFWQFSTLTAPPQLTVTNPPKDDVLYGSLITVNGQVSGGASVFINDSPILSDANGGFTSPIALQDGVNAIRISAKNHLGKTTTVTRNILANVPKTEAAVLPAEPFDGVALSVQIKDAATAITVMADGKEVFKGTMLPGTTQVFRATDELQLSTSNAGATYPTITNQVTVNVALGAIGNMGQTKNNLEFRKDTRFQ